MNLALASKKKLLFVITSLEGGGAERVVAHLVEDLTSAHQMVSGRQVFWGIILEHMGEGG